MKKIVLMVIFSLVSFLFIKTSTYAEEKIIDCYYYTNTTVGNNHAAHLILTTGAVTTETTHISNYDQGIIIVQNRRDLDNWSTQNPFSKNEDLGFEGQKWFKKSEKCFPHAFVVYNTGIISSTKLYVSDSDNKEKILEILTSHYIESKKDKDEFKIYAMDLLNLKQKSCTYNDDKMSATLNINEKGNFSNINYSLEGAPNSLTESTNYIGNWEESYWYNPSEKYNSYGYVGKENYIISKSCPEYLVYVRYKLSVGGNEKYNYIFYASSTSNKDALKKAVNNEMINNYGKTTNDFSVKELPYNKNVSIGKDKSTGETEITVTSGSKVCIYNNNLAGVSIKIDKSAKPTTLYSLIGSPKSINKSGSTSNWDSSTGEFRKEDRPSSNSRSAEKTIYDFGYSGKSSYLSSSSCPEYVLYARYNTKDNFEYRMYVTSKDNLENITAKVKTIMEVEKENALGEYVLIQLPYNKELSEEATAKIKEKEKETKEDEKEEKEVKANCTLIDKATRDMLKKILNIFRILAPILALVFSAMDFLKAVAAGAKDELKNAGVRFMKRLVIVVLLFFVPTIINLLLDLIGNSNGTCSVS